MAFDELAAAEGRGERDVAVGDSDLVPWLDVLRFGWFWAVLGDTDGMIPLREWMRSCSETTDSGVWVTTGVEEMRAIAMETKERS